MGIDLLNLEPHQVSKDLRGYSVFFYGDWKAGKTTVACKFPHHLLIAFEKGYAAIPGAMAQPVNSWGEFKKVLKQLKEPKVKEQFETVIVDTADIAYDYCSKYICNINDAQSVSDIPYGKGYGLIESEFDECLRQIVQLGYGLVIISHSTDKTFKDEKGEDYLKIVPTLDKRANNVIARMCDIIGYARSFVSDNGNEAKLYMRGTPRFEAGSRFKYTPDEIKFTYENLVNAIKTAVEKQEAEEGSNLFTDDREVIYEDTSDKLDYDALMEEFGAIITNLEEEEEPETMDNVIAPRIKQITERYLGKGKKASDCTIDQVEQLDLIVEDIKEFLKNRKNK